MSRLIFFDTEFTDLSSTASLVSAGFVTEDGDEFYAELADFRESECSEFVKANVLPLLGERRISTAAFVQSMIAWLAKHGGDVVLVADSDWDRKLLAKTFGAVGESLPESWVFRKAPDYFSSGRQRQIFNDETAAYFLRHPEERPHHALSDAYAIRQGFICAEIG